MDRRWAILVVVCVVVAAVGLACGADKASAPEIVRAQRFQLVDDRGGVRAELAMSEGQPGMTLYDAEGRIRADISLGSDGAPRLGLGWDNGKPCVLLSLDEVALGHRALLSLLDRRGRTRVALSVDPEDSPKVLLYDGNGAVRTALTLHSADGSPGLDLCDEEGRVVWAAP